MEVLYWLEGIRNPFLDTFFSLITHLGSETLFLAIAIIVFWCFSKTKGYYLMTVGFFGTLINQFLKLLCRIPRPWVKDPNFTIVEAAREEATGYSFPSGHTQNAVSVLGCPARSNKNTALRIVCILLILLTGLSRMYLGVHTPLDVGVSLVIGTVLVFAIYPIFVKSEEKPVYMYATLGTMALASLLYVLYVEFNTWPADIDPHNLASGIKNGYLIFGCGIGMIIAYFLEKKYIRFEVKAVWWAQILKVVLGLALVLGLKAGLKPVFNAICGGHQIATALRYGTIVLFAACVWPLTFPWFQKGCPMKKWVKKTLKVVLIVILVLVLLAGFLLWQITRDTTRKPIDTANAANPLITDVGVTMLSGHRAGGGIAPENTMMALKNCVNSTEYELDVFEFDFHLTADGVPVLLHDGTLDRTSDAAEYFGETDVQVGNKTLAELKNLNMGEKFVTDSGETPFAGLRGEDIPEDLRIVTLEEALTYLESCGEYSYIIEIKNSGDKGREAADKLYSTLKQFNAVERTVVGTFHNEVTAYLDTTYPDLPRSAGFNEVIEFYIYSLFNLPVKDGKFHFVALQIPPERSVLNLGTTRLVNYAHKHDIAVQYWTINEAEEMARLQAIGADTIMTDVPDVGAKVLIQP